MRSMTAREPQRESAGANISSKHLVIAGLAIAAMIAHLVLRFTEPAFMNWPLWVALALGGTPLVIDLLISVWRREFGSDLLAGISIVTAVILGEYLAGTLVVLMLSGGESLEAYAVRGASSVLDALARRMPNKAHRKVDSHIESVALGDLDVGDIVIVLPHEICPIDGTVLEGHSVMDESYLTGEPYMMSKTPGATVLSGAINGDSALTIRADRRAVDSRYARIMDVMETSQQQRPHLRRLGDQLGALYTPLAVGLALIAWVISADPTRFLAVLVVATPCPLLIAIPVAIIGSISLAAKRAIIVRDPIVLERIDTCRTIIFDKTGTLTYGRPQLVERLIGPGFEESDVVSLTASLEQYSKHPLAEAVVEAARKDNVHIHQASQISEPPGQGMTGLVQGKTIRITSRKHLAVNHPELLDQVPEQSGGLECIILINGAFAGLFRFRDAPRREGASFVTHLGPRHGVERIMLVSGDRASEVQYLADQVGIKRVYAGQTPEEKLEVTQRESKNAPTLFVGDGINDAPSLLAATVGVALGVTSDVTIEAAGAVIMDSSLGKVDELMHIGRRMRTIALQSVIGGMSLSIIGMFVAAAGFLPPVAGAIAQEVIDVFAVVNALRAAIPSSSLTDFD